MNIAPFAINEVSLLRAPVRRLRDCAFPSMAAVRMEELVCDGAAFLCTPAGSTAYNYSANGPICRWARTCWR